MSKDWQDIIDRAFERLMESRRARGWKPTPNPPFVSRLIREMPNLFLGLVREK